MNQDKMLSQNAAESILSMITVEKRFSTGDRLPNETELAEELNISRTTLREAVKILTAYGVLEIQRGRGTYVTRDTLPQSPGLQSLTAVKVNARDLYEMRLIFEPEAAYLAAVRGTDAEIRRIMGYGKRIEEEIMNGQDRTGDEHGFHKSIAQATHNEFMNQLMPILYQAIAKGVCLASGSAKALQDTVTDHRLIMEFLEFLMLTAAMLLLIFKPEKEKLAWGLLIVSWAVVVLMYVGHVSNAILGVLNI